MKITRIKVKIEKNFEQDISKIDANNKESDRNMQT